MDHTGWHCALLCSKMSSLVTARLMAPVELTSYAKHSLKNAMGQPNGQALFQGWRLPCLGLTVIGKLNTSGSSDEFDCTSYQAHILRSTPLFFLVSGAS